MCDNKVLPLVRPAQVDAQHRATAAWKRNGTGNTLKKKEQRRVYNYER